MTGVQTCALPICFPVTIARPFLGKVITLLVTSVYPTAAGRMIFGKVKRKLDTAS